MKIQTIKIYIETHQVKQIIIALLYLLLLSQDRSDYLAASGFMAILEILSYFLICFLMDKFWYSYYSAGFVYGLSTVL